MIKHALDLDVPFTLEDIILKAGSHQRASDPPLWLEQAISDLHCDSLADQQNNTYNTDLSTNTWRSAIPQRINRDGKCVHYFNVNEQIPRNRC